MDRDGDPLDLIRRFRQRAEAALPGRVVEVVLFGSRARGEAAADSDWDVAVFLTGQPGSAERRTLSDIAYDLVVETDHYIQHLPLPADRRHDDTLLLGHIRRDGIAL
ncbi:MAG: nucleotidyltransferase domain-containing protein [Magnetospirillum sp. WYHS-4]